MSPSRSTLLVTVLLATVTFGISGSVNFLVSQTVRRRLQHHHHEYEEHGGHGEQDHLLHHHHTRGQDHAEDDVDEMWGRHTREEGKSEGYEGQDDRGEEWGRHAPPPACTQEDSHNALEATKEFVACSGMDYTDLLAVVQADKDLLDSAVGCFAKVFVDAQAGDREATEVDFKDCVEDLEALDNASSSATSALLHKMLGQDSQVCPCLTDYVDAVPFCDQWARFRHMSQRLAALCRYMGANVEVTVIPNTSTDTKKAEVDEGEGDTPSIKEEDTKSKEANPKHTPGPEPNKDNGDKDNGDKDNGDKDNGGNVQVEVIPTARKEAPNQVKQQQHEEEEVLLHLPEPYPPCPPGQTTHASSPTKCQPMQSEKEDYATSKYGSGGWEHQEPKERLQVPGLGLIAMVAGAALVALGGVFGWRRYMDRDRQPRVRYMGMSGTDETGTELGSFGREYP